VNQEDKTIFRYTICCGSAHNFIGH
jgi:hypothetical protein